MTAFLHFIKAANNFLWNGPLLVLLFGTHLFFTVKLSFIQKKIKKAIHLSLSNKSDTHGNASRFSTLTTTLAATLGTGNIVGISTAIYLGGPGAVFWCWLTGLLGMATTYAECYLGIRYRILDKNNNYQGGPMYAMEHGLHSKTLAVFFSIMTVLCTFSMGCSTQARAITDVTTRLGIPPMISGILTATLIGLVIIGGVKKIQNFCMKIVPSMAAFYLIGCITILILNWRYLLPALTLILKSAFVPKALTGGIIGGGFSLAARYGIARGLFTNEAGLGSAAIAAASTSCTDIKEQSYVSMSATFWDTVVMCALTGIIIISTLIKSPLSATALAGSELTTAAFSQIPYIGKGMLWLSLCAFAVATLIGWSYFGEKAFRYLFHGKGISCYRLLYILMVFFGSVMSLDFVWESADLINALMALPNILLLFLLHKEISA